MPKFPKRCIESVDEAIKGTSLMLDSLKMARASAVSIPRGHTEGAVKLYELEIDNSRNTLFAILPHILFSSANSEHLNKQCHDLKGYLEDLMRPRKKNDSENEVG